MRDSSIKSVCVFCGASEGKYPVFRTAAEDLGRQLAENDIRLVFGGGNVGMMGAVADAVLANCGEAIGVIPEFLCDRELAHKGLTELHIVDSMHTRKRMMFELSDAFIALPGGLGTLEEVFEMITWRRLDQHVKPIILISTDDYWEPFDSLVRNVVENGFAHTNALAHFCSVADPSTAIDRLVKQ
ncbi:MAG: Cytokinin riboside 5'-monophosphate phosphoribohydrolase [Alphaproteobacteria bacterium MarineAlpha11_Bin1]|nr:MAG: Cytokinin riboside 5'-monophosphate phosphoribohydrolase [Alphaproteobacteria bacterium MarineAlpha11_Bin1]|tara:strand:- start:8183 stop:8737 length:555 start_codon:yes stop_codon:yes gene_type:complete